MVWVNVTSTSGGQGWNFGSRLGGQTSTQFVPFCTSKIGIEDIHYLLGVTQLQAENWFKATKFDKLYIKTH